MIEGLIDPSILIVERCQAWKFEAAPRPEKR